jgi:hypothetical protein
VRFATSLAVFLLSHSAFAQAWNPTQPVWAQAAKVTCTETSRYGCEIGKQCRSGKGIAKFVFSFDEKRVSFAGSGRGQPIAGQVFTYYEAIKTETMSLLLGDGRLFSFSYRQAPGSQNNEVVGYAIGHNRRGEADDIDTIVFACTKS